MANIDKTMECNATHKKGNLDKIFVTTCELGYITYAKSLVCRYKIDIHATYELAFRR